MISTYTSKLKQLQIGDLIAKIPIIQGGMGVGISRSHLAGAVAKEGGVGIISTAQIGYDEEGFENDQAGCNLKAIKKHIRKAKELACGNGLVGVNIMVALKHYKEHVQAAVAAGADVIISGAGLPMNLPELVSRTCRTKIAPIVSSKRATQLILKMWAHRYDRTADFIVVEGPKAGGHLGFSNEQLAHMDAINFDGEIRQIIDCKRNTNSGIRKIFRSLWPAGYLIRKIFRMRWISARMVCRLPAALSQPKNVMHRRHTRRRIFTPVRKILRLSKARSVCRDVHCAISLSIV